MTEPVVIYGASGYTGKLIAWHMAEARIPFVAAGRDRDRLDAQMARVPELAEASFRTAAAHHDDEAGLTETFRGAKIVYNVAGPFMQLAEPVVRAALAAGCHYLDTTGETDWMRIIRDRYGAEFASKGLLLAPATSWMWTAGQMAAEIALETPGVDTLDLLYLADSATSVASTQSFLRMCTSPQYYIEHGELVMWPYATSYPVVGADSHRVYRALPWSGGGESVWFEGDARVRNCATLVAFRSEAMFGAVVSLLEDFEAKYRHVPIEEHPRITNEIAGTIVGVEPEREQPSHNRSIISCIGRGNTTAKTVILRGNSPYLQTGALAAEACRRILDGRLLKTGFQAATAAFGTRSLLASLAERGFHHWEAH